LGSEPRSMHVETPAMPAYAGIKVLHVIDNLGLGGAETWLLELLRFWDRNGSNNPQFDFLATGGVPTYYDEEAKRYGAAIYYLPYRKSHLLSFARGFREILRRGRYAAIHDHADSISGWHFLLAGNALPPVRISHVHTVKVSSHYGLNLPRRLTAELGNRLVARYATRIAGTSKKILEDYEFDTPRFRHIARSALYCGFDTTPVADVAAARRSVRRELGWPADARIVLVAGRIDPSPELNHAWNQKNSAFAASIAIVAARRDPALRVAFAGALSPAVAVLEQQIADAGLAGCIRFLGVRTDLKRLMYASDALLFPSRGEGLGMVAVEAQAAGLPVLASSVVPHECVVLPELVRFESLERSAKDWAAALLQQAALPRDIAAANRRVAASPFSIENSARALIELYSQGLRT